MRSRTLILSMDKLVTLLTVGLFVAYSAPALAQGAKSEEKPSLSDARDHLGNIKGYIADKKGKFAIRGCLLYTSPSPRDRG